MAIGKGGACVGVWHGVCGKIVCVHVQVGKREVGGGGMLRQCYRVTPSR